MLATELARDAALGKADALMALGRASEGLTVLDELAAASPADLEVVEARVVALRRLGRATDAEEAERRLVVASGGRSDLRVRP